jgi:hypothetical protein
MVDSTLGALAVLLLAGVILFFVNPIIAILPLLLIFALLGLKAAGSLFKHAAPPVDSSTGATGAGSGPATPTSADAAYEPVANPSDRGV